MGLIGTIVGGVASAAGGLIAGNKMKEQDELFNNRMRDIKAHRDSIYYRDPTQTADNQAALTQAKELMKENVQRTAGTGAVTGGTPEAEALAKKQGSQVVGNMLQQQAVQGAQQREQVYNNSEQQVDAYTKYLADSKKAQAQAIAQAAGGLAGAAGNLPI